MSHEDAPTEAQVAKYAYLSPMLDSALAEMREFSKKKQDGIVSEVKIKVLNRLLKEIKDVVAKEESAAYLDLLSEDELPQNSDAVLMLGQFRAALDSFHSRRYRTVGYEWAWMTKEWLEEHDRMREAGELDEDDDEFE